MKIHFNCDTTSYSGCKGKPEHRKETIKRYVAKDYGRYRMIEICDHHFDSKFGWRDIYPVCTIGCNHLRCQEVYK